MLTRFTLRHRLGLMLGLMTSLGGGIIVGAWYALERIGHADDRERQVIAALRLHQDADMMHDALRADVYAAFLGSGNALEQLRAHRRALDANLAQLDTLELDPESRASLSGVRGPLSVWSDQAEDLARGAAGHPTGAAPQLAPFTAEFAQIADQMAATTGVLVGARHAAEQSAASERRSIQWGLAAGIAFAVEVTFAAMAMVGARVVTGLSGIREVAARLSAGDLAARNALSGNDEISDLGRTFNELGDSLHRMAARSLAESQRVQFARQLGEALEMAEREADVIDVLDRALAGLAPAGLATLMLADSSRAKLKVVTSDLAGPCTVTSPWGCVAMRRATTMTFAASGALDACPHLRDVEPCSAVCLPVSFSARAIGVLRTTAPVGAENPDAVARFTTLANQAGARIGAIRAMDQARLQAGTDALTGLVNRRSLEARIRQIEEPYAVIMADLDHFKKLNDTYGHQAGDHALRIFGQTVRNQQRADDLCCRYGGEEFVLVLPRSTAPDAVVAADRIRVALAASFNGGSPAFTVSCGVADSTMRDTFEEVLRVADGALYAAKAQGRDRAVLGSPA